mgnify:CR=1 FL=1
MRHSFLAVTAAALALSGCVAAVPVAPISLESGLAERLGLTMRRVPTVGVDPEFVHGLVDLLEERAAETRGESPEHPAWPGEARPSVCEPGCCPNLRAAKPALCGRD